MVESIDKTIEIDEEDILRYIVEFENTQLLENDTIKQLENLECSNDVLYSEKERTALQRKLQEVRDRYRINPFVIEKDGEFVLKYDHDGKQVIRNPEENPIHKLNRVPRLNIVIPDEKEEVQELNTNEKSGIESIDNILKQEKHFKNNIKVSSKVKVSPPNPRRQFRNPEWNDGKLPLIRGIMFRSITSIMYKNYPGSKRKKFVSLLEKKKEDMFTKEYYRYMDITPHKENSIFFKPKVDEKQKKLNDMFSKIAPFLTSSSSKNDGYGGNIMRIIKSVQ